MQLAGLHFDRHFILAVWQLACRRRQRDLIEIGVDDKDGRPLLRERKLMTARQASYTVVVGGRPGKAGIDPDNKLIDRKPDDNMIAVDTSEP